MPVPVDENCLKTPVQVLGRPLAAYDQKLGSQIGF